MKLPSLACAWCHLDRVPVRTTTQPTAQQLCSACAAANCALIVSEASLLNYGSNKLYSSWSNVKNVCILLDHKTKYVTQDVNATPFEKNRNQWSK